ncbi:serine O-acetyltransferase [Olivibacter sp. XZL3]|uniref:serine O-acetyltransferase n=1 Tax=Olivibacter sp. XZL3 TaxID=1735116 RepID=UPI001065B54A|nr:serine acetyltransferase [Olivibacter sp. XZL3]
MTTWLKSSWYDLKELRAQYELHPLMAIIANRGFHALFVYRLSNWLYRIRIPLLPLLFTRIIQVLYAIDIDYKAKIQGGVIIIHGVGLVIGEGAIIEKGSVLYHGVTLGRKTQGKYTPEGDGFPQVGRDCVIGAGAKLLGAVIIGAGSIVGANCVVTESLEEASLIKLSQSSYLVKSLRKPLLTD